MVSSFSLPIPGSKVDHLGWGDWSRKGLTSWTSLKCYRTGPPHYKTDSYCPVMEPFEPNRIVFEGIG